jgi:hypothetical protein
MAEREVRGMALVALRAQAELERFHEGLLRVSLLCGAGVSLVPAVTMPFRARPYSVPVVLGAAALLAVCYLMAEHWRKPLYWILGSTPGLVLPVSLAVGVVLAADGIGSPGAVFTFPALALVASVTAAGRPVWGWITAVALIVSANAAGALLHVAGTSVVFQPLNANALGSDTLIVGYTVLFTLIFEHQSQHVAVTALHNQLALGTTPSTATSTAGSATVVREAPLALGRPEPEHDIALLTKRDLGLSSRELEVLLLLLAGEDEQEIALHLAWITPGRGRALSRSTVRKQIDSAARKIAASQGEERATVDRAVALFGRRLDELTAQHAP